MVYITLFLHSWQITCDMDINEKLQPVSKTPLQMKLFVTWDLYRVWYIILLEKVSFSKCKNVENLKTLMIYNILFVISAANVWNFIIHTKTLLKDIFKNTGIIRFFAIVVENICLHKNKCLKMLLSNNILIFRIQEF